MPSVTPNEPGLLEGSPPPPVSPAPSMELGGSLGDMTFTSQCSVESLGSLDSGHSSADNGTTDSPSPGANSPTPIINTPPAINTSSTPASPRVHGGECTYSPRISVSSMGCQDRPASRIDRSLSNTSTTSINSDFSLNSNETMSSSTTLNSSATLASDHTNTTSTSTSSTTIVTPRKSKAELDAYIDHLDSLWSQEDEWIMIFDNLIKNTEASTRTRRHTHHHSHYHKSGTTSYHSSPYNSPYKRVLRNRYEDEDLWVKDITHTRALVWIQVRMDSILIYGGIRGITHNSSIWSNVVIDLDGLP
ncbi:uncharacterized serine-rich protein C215.13-like [Homarus americanus]|uniref:uncharacterized serine-rich protein C215.13-like n=1 Tax=Homarus americanus TaxID=6706 RepID=UPI001C447921|nr:uncharacterized serine-rich protein C215.13-like [Homarus americanus]